MKFNGPVLAAMVGLCAGVQAFNVGVPLGPNSRQAAGMQRSRWVSMSDKGTAAAAAAAAPTKKRSITVSFVQETPGGYICGVDVVNFKTASTHRIVASKEQLEEYRERAGMQVDVSDLMTYVIKYMMDKGIKLENTEGMIEASVFPVNYFTIKQLTYFHDDVEDKIVELCKQAPGLSEF